MTPHSGGYKPNVHNMRQKAVGFGIFIEFVTCKYKVRLFLFGNNLKFNNTFDILGKYLCC